MNFSLPPNSKILVIKLADLGDVLTATPALRALRNACPDAQIDLLLTHHTQAVMEYSNLVDSLIPSDNFRFFSLKDALKPGLLKEGRALLKRLRRQKYDAVLVLHHLSTKAGALKYAAIARISGAKMIAGLKPPGRRGNFLTHAVPDKGFGAQHEIDYWLAVAALLGAQSDNRQMELPVSPADDAWAEQLIASLPSPPPTRSPAHPPTRSPAHPLTRSPAHPLTRSPAHPPTRSPAHPPRPLVVIHPGSGGFTPARRWRAENFAAVADALSKKGSQIILVGTQNDGVDAVQRAMSRPALNLSEQTTLHQLTALLKRADLFIGGDSGVTHIAAASNAPVIAIFGPTNAAAWGPGEGRKDEGGRMKDEGVKSNLSFILHPSSFAVTLQADIPCAPCAYVDYGVGLRHGCPAKTCLKLISVEQVLSAVNGQRSAVSGQPSAASRHSSFVIRHSSFEKAVILGVHIHAVTFQQALTQIEAFIAEGGPHQITTVNPEFIVAAQKDPVFRQIINRASLAFADGAGVLKAAKWLKQPALPERIPGVDMVEALAALSAQKGYKIYFLGAMPGVAEKAVAALQKRYPGMRAVGAFAGSPRAEDEDEIVAKIQAAHPDIVLVAYGAPQQDKWIARNMQRWPASVLMGVGGAFDFISGAAQRAPKWAQQLNLEWLHRLIHQPWRWRRIWNAVPRFMWLVFWSR